MDNRNPAKTPMRARGQRDGGKMKMEVNIDMKIKAEMKMEMEMKMKMNVNEDMKMEVEGGDGRWRRWGSGKKIPPPGVLAVSGGRT
jgi:hypothetical protein